MCSCLSERQSLSYLFCQNIVAAVLTVVALVAFLALEHTVFYVFEHCIHGEIIIREQRTVGIGKRIKIKYYVFGFITSVVMPFSSILTAFRQHSAVPYFVTDAGTSNDTEFSSFLSRGR